MDENGYRQVLGQGTFHYVHFNGRPPLKPIVEEMFDFIMIALHWKWDHLVGDVSGQKAPMAIEDIERLIPQPLLNALCLQYFGEDPEVTQTFALQGVEYADGEGVANKLFIQHDWKRINRFGMMRYRETLCFYGD